MIRLMASTMAPPRLVETSGQMAMMRTQGNRTASRFRRAECFRALAPSQRTHARPPKSQHRGPEQIEILRGVGAIGIGAKLSFGILLVTRHNQPEQFVPAFRALHQALDGQHDSVDGQNPEQTPQANRQAESRADLEKPSSPKRAASFGDNVSSQSRKAQNKPASPRYFQNASQLLAWS